MGLHWRYRHWGAACSKDQEGGRQEAEGRDFKGPGLIVDVKEEKRRGKVGRVGRKVRGRREGKCGQQLLESLRIYSPQVQLTDCKGRWRGKFWPRGGGDVVEMGHMSTKCRSSVSAWPQFP